MKKLKCIICGKEYETCNCASDKVNKAWKIICDTSNHYQIHCILNDYSFGNINKTQAKNLLNKCNIKDYQNYIPSVVNLIDKILEEELPQQNIKNKSKIIKKNKKSK